jgi:tetrapyrrole methylase family protein / MazG family protein
MGGCDHDGQAAGAQDPFRRLVDVMARLRSPDGCPWDREQTHATLRRYMVEECHEVLDAVDEGDDGKLAEELGDVLLQVVFHAELAEERGAFDIDAVCRAIVAKLERRHPHVFGDVQVSGSADVLRNWEAIKKDERREARAPDSVLAGVPRSLPSLPRAQAVQKKAASVGFDWDDPSGAYEKLREELDEVGEAVALGDRAKVREELGDLLFAAINVARMLDLDADEALRGTLKKFEERFHYIEQCAAADGRSLEAMSIIEMDALWEEAKAARGGNGTPP